MLNYLVSRVYGYPIRRIKQGTQLLQVFPTGVTRLHSLSFVRKAQFLACRNSFSAI